MYVGEVFHELKLLDLKRLQLLPMDFVPLMGERIVSL
jgi:hypothetical protein